MSVMVLIDALRCPIQWTPSTRIWLFLQSGSLCRGGHYNKSPASRALYWGQWESFNRSWLSYLALTKKIDLYSLVVGGWSSSSAEYVL